jgi:hypothetical protein
MLFPSVRVQNMALTWCFGGAEGTRTPDPLQWFAESPWLESSREVSAHHRLTWADALNHGHQGWSLYRRLSGEIG